MACSGWPILKVEDCHMAVLSEWSLNGRRGAT